MSFSLEQHIESIIEAKIQPLKQEIEQLRKINVNPVSKEYLSAKEVKEIYGISASTLWRHCRDGKICKYILEGKTLYKKVDLDAFVTVI